MSTLGKAGKTEADYQQMVALHKRVIELEATAAKLTEVEKTVGKAATAVEAYQRETKAILEARKAGLSVLRKKHAELEARRKAFNEAHCNLEVIKFENPTVFGLEHFDLDRYTLTSGAGQNVLNFADPTAQRLEVPVNVWTKEARRRGAIHQAATNRAFAEHKAKAATWHLKQPKDYSGHRATDESYPSFQPPGWGEIVKRGWNVTLDGLVA